MKKLRQVVSLLLALAMLMSAALSEEQIGTLMGNVSETKTVTLTSFNIPNGVTSINDMVFYGCSLLKSITIPDSVTSIGGLAFGYCFSLTSINIPAKLTSIDDMVFLVALH